MNAISKINVCAAISTKNWRYELIFKDGSSWTMRESKSIAVIVEEAERFKIASGLRLFMSPRARAAAAALKGRFSKR